MAASHTACLECSGRETRGVGSRNESPPEGFRGRTTVGTEDEALPRRCIAIV